MNRRRMTGHRANAGGGAINPLADVAAYWRLESSAGTEDVGDLDLTLSSATGVTFPASKKNNGLRHTVNAFRTFTRAIGSAGLLTVPQDGFTLSIWSFVIPQVSPFYPGLAALGNNSGGSLDYGWAIVRECDLAGTLRTTKFFTQAADGTIDYITSNVDIGGGDNVWFHYCVTRAAGEDARIRLYVNGNMVEGTSTGCKTPSSAPFTLGAVSFSHIDLGGEGFGFSSSPLRGGIDEAAYWTRELTSEEVAALYNSGSGVFLP